MHITSNVRDSTRIPIGAVLVVLPMLSNSEARITAITNGLAGGPEWIMNGAPLVVGPFTVPAEVRIECIEGDVAWDAVYPQDLNVDGEISALQGAVDTLNGEYSSLSGTMSGLSSTVGSLSSTVSGLSTAVSSNSSAITSLSSTVSSLSGSVSGLGTTVGVIDDTIAGTGDGATDNAAVFSGAVSASGSFVTAGKVAARFAKQGTYAFASMADVHPSVSLLMKARGGILLVPPGNLSSANADGAQGSLLRVLRRSPASGSNLAWGFCMSGVNLDARGVTFSQGSFSVDAGGVTSDTITATAHGLPNGFALYVTGSSLPGGLSKGTLYWVANATTDTFQLKNSATASLPVDITSTGSGTWGTLFHGVRVPNADPSKNASDPDPTFAGNKDYVAGRYEFGDIVNFPGSGLVLESTNGRADIHSFRCLNNGIATFSGDTGTGHGFDFGGNDIVMSGHSAAGGNYGFGIKVGNASGFFATTLNVWGLSALRSLSCGAMWINQRKAFGIICSEFNDWIRADGGASDWRGGNISLNSFASFNELFNGDGMANDLTSTGADPRLQAFVGITAYKSLNLIANNWFRTTDTSKVSQPGGAFHSWQNVGGDLVGAGTAFNNFVDVSRSGYVNMIDTVCSAPNVKPWTGVPLTVSSITAGVVTTASAHGMQVNDKVAFADTGTLPAGIYPGVPYFVQSVPSTTTFTVANVPDAGAGISTTGSISGTVKCAKLNTLPYAARTNSQIQYALFDSFTGEARFGVRGNGKKSRLLLGIADSDMARHTGIGPLPVTSISGNTFTLNGHGMQDGYPVVFNTTGTLPAGLSLSKQYWAINTTTNTFQVSADYFGNVVSLSDVGSGTHSINSWYRTYCIEAGDRTISNGTVNRNVLWGSWEFDNAPQFTDGTLQRNSFTGGTFSANVKAGIHLRHIVLSGGAFTSGTITLPTGADMKGSQALRVVITNNSCDSLTWAFSNGGGWTVGGITAPAWVPAGGLVVDLWYERDQGTWTVLNYLTDGGRLGRIDNVNAPVGTVGEQIFSKVLQASAVALTTNTLATLTSIVLTPGDWSVSANAIFSSTSTTSSNTSNVKASIGTASGAISASDPTGYAVRNTSTTATTTSGTDLDSLSIPQWRITVPAGTTQTVYLNVKAALTGTVGAWGGIRAIRTT